MIGFFKRVGKGLGYIFFVPLYFALICIVGAFGIILLFFLFVKALYLFFTGRSMHDDLPEDVKAKEVLQRSNPNYVEPTVQKEEKVPFSSLFVKEEKQEEIKEPVTEPSIEEVAFQDDLIKDIQQEEEDILQPFEQPKMEEKSIKPVEEIEEELERYTPLTNKENQNTFFSDMSIDKEDDE